MEQEGFVKRALNGVVERVVPTKTSKRRNKGNKRKRPEVQSSGNQLASPALSEEPADFARLAEVQSEAASLQASSATEADSLLRALLDED